MKRSEYGTAEHLGSILKLDVTVLNCSQFIQLVYFMRQWSKEDNSEYETQRRNKLSYEGKIKDTQETDLFNRQEEASYIVFKKIWDSYPYPLHFDQWWDLLKGLWRDNEHLWGDLFPISSF